MEGHLKLYIFGDQTFDIQLHRKELLRNRDNPVLEDFLVKAYDGVRAEIYKIPRQQRDDIPRFTSVDDLLLWDQSGKRCIPLDMAVTCMFQLGVFLSQEVETWYYAADKCLTLGLCTGALAAAAVSCSRSPLDLVLMAVDAVIVAFRIGMRVVDVAGRVAPLRDSDQSWSIIVPGLKASESVDKFNKQTALPLTSRPYVSAFTPNGVTVSGPPASLAQLLDGGGITEHRCKSITIYGPYHASHLYSELDVNDIVGDLASGTSTVKPSHIPLPFISGTGSRVQGCNFASVLKAAVEQILLQPIRWNDILEELRTQIQMVGPTSFSVIPIGTTAEQLVYIALKQTPLRNLVPNTESRSKPSSFRDTVYPNPTKPKLAIIGMSGRFPGAKDNDAFWNLLYQGLDVHKSVPALHWDAKTHVDPTGTRKNTSATPYGCWLDHPAVFDARFFSISPREAPQIDPAQRLALMTAYEAIEQAGLVPGATPSTRHDRVGVFYGVTSNDWMETNSAQDIDTYFIPGGNRAFIPGRINYFFKFSGPSYAVDTACSSSLAGIHLACNSLWRRDVDTAIAGGTNVLTNPDFTAGLDRGHFLSRTGNCKTFDDEADGYCRGEGIGTVIIKRLDDALADHDPILGVILGASTNHSAESESITRPHVGAQRAIFTKILNQAAVDPYTISYVEMHGTGTQAGDAGEMSSVLDTFAPPHARVKRGRTSEETLHLGSAKANIGHGEAASGVSSLIKVLLMMQKNTIVPHCGIKTRINRKFPTDLQERNVQIAAKPTPWARNPDKTKPRRVFVNNFSAAGGNSALLLEDAPLTQEPAAGGAATTNSDDPRGIHLVAVSAKTGTSLQGNLRSMANFLQHNPQVPLGHLSYTTTARRVHHQHRVMLAGATVDELCTQIDTRLQDGTGMTRPKRAPKVVFAFTGQGAQYPGMGKQLFQALSFFRNEMCRLDQIVKSLGFPSMLPLIESDEPDIGGFSPTVVQTANVCMQIALSKLWASWNIMPSAVVGHSLGEYAALNAAGVLSDADTIYLVGKRAELLLEKCSRDTHGMLVVKGSTEDIAAVLKDRYYEIACINSPIETVLAGSNHGIATLKDLLTNSGMKTTLLKVPYAFHSSQVEPMLADFRELARGVTYHKATIPVICPLDTHVRDSTDSFDPNYLVSHTRQPVNMLEALREAHKHPAIDSLTPILEIGPHPAISGMVRAVLGPQVTCLASAQRGRSIWQILGTALKTLYHAGADISWADYHRDFKVSHKVLPLPAYSWDLKEYWMQYVHDWSLRKGDPPLTSSDAPRLESTTIHRVVQETHSSDRTHIVVEADIAREDLSPLVQGHEVDGIPLCTPSVYADMALTLGTYILRRYRPDQLETNLVDVSDMTISKALILRAGVNEQLLQAHAEVDWPSQSAAIGFMSFDSKQKLQEHARCVVRFKDKNVQQVLLQANSSSLKAKMQCLRDGIASGVTARFNRPMVYRAIRPLARFHDDYRAIDEIVLNSKTLEASSRLGFGTVKRSGTFHTHPAIIDSLTQSCGFTMNCNDATDLDKEVFMNHGWGSFQLFDAIDFDKEYTTYTRMEERADKLWHGDVVIFDGDRVVAYFGQIAIQGVPRRVLKVILSIESGNKPSQKRQQEAPQRAGSATTLQAATTFPSFVAGESSGSSLAKALSIIAEESGLAVADLTDSVVFTDVGIDSLLGLTITARFKEELDLDLDFNALFFEYPTVGDLKVFVGEPGTSTSTCGETKSAASSRTSATGVTTPDRDVSPTPTVDFQRALAIISEESMVAVEELTDDTSFADSGVDSLLSLIIVSRFRDELGLDIQHESLLLEHPTVRDLKRELLGDLATTTSQIPVAKSETVSVMVPDTNTVEGSPVANRISQQTPSEAASLQARKAAVNHYVNKHTAGFAVPHASTPPSGSPGDSGGKVVLITGATGSLGSNLVHHMAQLPDVTKVICLNRENKADPYVRQQKAMREKGIRFPEALKPKLLVLQTDATKPMLGLPRSEYEGLVNTVTHLIHNAWPMSAKRPLAGFEPQFQIMQNLIHLARDAATQRPQSFRFSFQMVSSIAVVGRYGLGGGDTEKKIQVPEERMDIDSVLPNGYGDAKWGCERMLDETLHQHPDRFRTMTVRLGQIAGSKTSGYWNPMEHFGFLIKSSQTLNALPDVEGTVYWTTVNDIAAVLSELVLSRQDPYPIYHIENPVGQSWRETNAILADALKIPNLIPFKEWVERVRAAPTKNNPAFTLLDFLDSNYLRLSCGGLVLSVNRTLEHSKVLSAVGPVSEEVVRRYIHIWKEIGFLN